jgi:hypothetical protein
MERYCPLRTVNILTRESKLRKRVWHRINGC